MDVSSSLSNVMTTIVPAKNTQNSPNISSLKKAMRDGRNIVVPRISKGKKMDITSGSKYKDYITSYFNAKGNSNSQNKASSLPPIRDGAKYKTPIPVHSTNSSCKEDDPDRLFVKQKHSLAIDGFKSSKK